MGLNLSRVIHRFRKGAGIQAARSSISLKFRAPADAILTRMAAPRQTELDGLLEHARRVAENSYSPYSHFKVGAALLLADGGIVTGTNVENTSYGMTICAERAALVQAISRFGPSIRVRAVAVTNLNGAASPPCGGCRQVLAEFTDAEAPVVFPAFDGIRVMPFGQLLPLATDMKLR